MIKYDNYSINGWNFGASNIIKVYRNNAVCYYKITDSSTPTYDICYAVVDDISDYSDTEFIDVYDKATEKWYKLNNLNEYEEYGIYGQGRNITYYKGKLTIDGTHEYEWNGSSWSDLGELEGGTITIKSPEYLERNSSHKGSVPLNYDFKNNSRIQVKLYSTSNGGSIIIGDVTAASDSDDCRFFFASSTMYLDLKDKRITTSGGNTGVLREYEFGNFYIENISTGTKVITGATVSLTKTYPMSWGKINGGDYNRIYYIKTYDGDTLVQDLIPWTDMNGSYGFYDKVSNSTLLQEGSITASSVINDVEVGSVVYPKYYAEQSEPLNDLVFLTMEDANTYAYNNCVYDGMKATIGGSKYYFDSENGWVKVLEYYKFEDVTPNGASGWTISGSSTYNPDSTYYDDFDLQTTSTSTLYKIGKVTIYGYDHFTYYLRTSGYSSYNYVVATNVDEVSTPPTAMTYNSASAITNTYNWNKSPKSAVNLSNYRRVTYNNLDKNVEHTFYVYFCGRTYSSHVGNATILIPKEQTNENWEQVTFSITSNVASAQKYLYVDNNNSTSGGTNYFYTKWIVGLPSGSHTSYTNYSNFDYCPTVSSATFTSVAGNVRNVEYEYEPFTTKSLSVRLTDGDNVLTPSDTVYYNLYTWNPCGVRKTDNNYTFPRSIIVPIGGRFQFQNSYDRGYIYGYQSPSTSITYNANDYVNTFDLVYTKLNEEAVTITYTTYDPNDTEIPTFKTDITYPYNGGTVSSTTLTSYNVPYTYPYQVEENSGMFSADAQSYTASQTTRAITFTLYPNYREFATVADMEAYGYAWEGMKASVGQTNYKYENGEWTEYSGKENNFVIGDFENLITNVNDITEGYYIIYSAHYESGYANKNYLFSWNSGNTWDGNYTLGNMTHRDATTSTVITADEIIDDAVWQFIPDGNGNFYIKNVARGLYWTYTAKNANYGLQLNSDVNQAVGVNIPEYFTIPSNNLSGLPFVETSSGENNAINRLYSYSYRYNFYNSNYTIADGNNCYHIRKYIP